MILLKGFLLIVMMLVVPVVVGTLLTAHMEERYKDKILTNWVFGLAMMFAQTQIIAVPLVLLRKPFHFLWMTWGVITVIEIAVAIIKYRASVMVMGKTLIPSLKKAGIFGVLVILSIAIQVLALSYFEHRDDDDARFVPSAVAAVEKNIMFMENPVTGEQMYSSFSEMFKDMVSPWIMFWAIIAKVTFIHPAILMHTLVPIFLIPLAYAVYWLLSGCLFTQDGDEEKRVVFVGLVSLIHIFSGYSRFNSGAFLLFRIWQGKAIFAAIFIPLLIFLALRLMMRNKENQFMDYFQVAVVSCGACLTSGFGIILSLMGMGIMSLIYGVGCKNPKGMVYLWISLISCVVFGFLYAFGGKFFM